MLLANPLDTVLQLVLLGFVAWLVYQLIAGGD